MFTHKGYKAAITIDLESEVICGKILEINDVITFEGKTVREAKQEFVKSVDIYLEFCRQEKIEPEKPFSGRLPFRTTSEIHRMIYRAATQAGKSINAWMEDALKESAHRASSRSPNEDGEPLSPSVQTLIEDRNGVAQLVNTVSPFLKTPDSVQLLSRLEKLVIGLDAVQPLLNPEEVNPLISTVEAIGRLLKIIPNAEIDPSDRPVHPEVKSSESDRTTTHVPTID